MSRYIFENLKQGTSLVFSDPQRRIRCYSAKDIAEFFAEAESMLCQGYAVAGYFTYEAGIPFVLGREPGTLLADFTVFKSYNKQPVVYADSQAIEIHDENFSVSKSEYLRNIRHIREEIQKGNLYQANYTMQKTFRHTSSAWNLYNWLKQLFTVEYAAFIENEDEAVISFSPELFFSVTDGEIKTRPMKGTSARGRFTEEDERLMQRLQQDAKNRAENSMIVDLLRNDLGKIAVAGSIKTQDLFAIEKYESVLQMTSTITASLKNNCSTFDIFKSLFPCGSITGAPKKASMQLIDSLEKQHRGVYSGAIGYFLPDNSCVFNVAIRSIVSRKQQAAFGTGSGIVWDSDAEMEYAETLLKTGFLSDKPFQLIETMLLANGKFRLLDRHLKRLERACAFYLFHYNKNPILQKLADIAAENPSGKYRVRILHYKSGKTEITASRLQQKPKTGLIRLSALRTDPGSSFTFHKTTNRNLYDSQYQQALAQGLSDYIFLNNQGNLTEGCISNIFLKINGNWFTPHREDGLLQGIFRNYLLEKYSRIQEAHLTEQDLLHCEQIILCSSLRGITRVKLQTENTPSQPL